jgi:hypothetical protein
MKNSFDCPGNGKCHAPGMWCDCCGDVSLVCDDPACMAHDRIEEVHAKLDTALERCKSLKEELAEAESEMEDFLSLLIKHVFGKVNMVARKK